MSERRRLSPRWRERLIGAAGLAAAAAILGLGAAALGLVSIAASSGHWPITALFLHQTMRSAVDTRAAFIDKPPEIDLDDPALVARGASHFDSGCAPCHGTPSAAGSTIVQHSTPHPPWLPPRIPEWEDDELFFILKHGIKFSGMPAWPTQRRDDEVWSMVAFARRLPQIEDPEYRRLAGLGRADDALSALAGEEAGAAPETGRAAVRLARLVEPIGPVLAESCARCHGLDGLGRGLGAFPKLAGQSEAYLYASLQAYADGARASGFMQPVAAALTEPQMRELAAYYAALPPGGAAEVDPGGLGLPEPPAPEEIEELIALGARLAADGAPERGVPGCVSCHGPGGEPRVALYPELSGQYPRYLATQLELFHERDRGGTAYSDIMYVVAEELTKREMAALAAYYGSLEAGSLRAARR